jgi:hypothetical protein
VETVTLVNASVADHLMVGLKPGTDPQLAAAALREKGYAVRAIEPDSYILVELPQSDNAGDQAKTAADLAALEEFIDHAEPDYLVLPTLVPNDPDYSQGKMWASTTLAPVRTPAQTRTSMHRKAGRSAGTRPPSSSP